MSHQHRPDLEDDDTGDSLDGLILSVVDSLGDGPDSQRHARPTSAPPVEGNSISQNLFLNERRDPLQEFLTKSPGQMLGGGIRKRPDQMPGQNQQQHMDGGNNNSQMGIDDVLSAFPNMSLSSPTSPLGQTAARFDFLDLSRSASNHYHTTTSGMHSAMPPPPVQDANHQRSLSQGSYGYPLGPQLLHQVSGHMTGSTPHSSPPLSESGEPALGEDRGEVEIQQQIQELQRRLWQQRQMSQHMKQSGNMVYPQQQQVSRMGSDGWAQQQQPRQQSYGTSGYNSSTVSNYVQGNMNGRYELQSYMDAPTFDRQPQYGHVQQPHQQHQQHQQHQSHHNSHGGGHQHHKSNMGHNSHSGQHQHNQQKMNMGGRNQQQHHHQQQQQQQVNLTAIPNGYGSSLGYPNASSTPPPMSNGTSSGTNALQADKLPADAPLEQLEGRFLQLAQEQNGCRYLQQRIAREGAPGAALVLREVFPHLVQLMMDPFANYMYQKLLEHASPDQRVRMLEAVRGSLLVASLNLHGTRSVQKHIEMGGKDARQRDIIAAELAPYVTKLSMDTNGNHVVQRMLQHLDRCEFVCEAIINDLLIVTRHRHGCCVVQRSLDAADSPMRVALIRKIEENALQLMQDPFANYTVQYVIENGRPGEGVRIIELIRGKMETLSKQKFSSNVVERCLSAAPAYLLQHLVDEAISCMGELLHDAFANFVAQKMLDPITTDLQARNIVAAMRPHLLDLNSSCSRRVANRIVKRFPELVADEVIQKVLGPGPGLIAVPMTLQGVPPPPPPHMAGMMRGPHMGHPHQMAVAAMRHPGAQMM